MLNTILENICNGLLVGTTGYAMYAVNPIKYPFAFTAAAVGFFHGCTAIFISFGEGSEDSEDIYIKRAEKLITSCMEIIPVPLINIDIYRSSQQSNALALGHGLFIIALGFDLSYKFFANDGDNGESTAVLKDLTILGNIVSLMFFATNENNFPAAIMALSAFFAYHGSMMMESVLRGTGKNSSIAGNCLLFGLLPLAIGTVGIMGR